MRATSRISNIPEPAAVAPLFLAWPKPPLAAAAQTIVNPGFIYGDTDLIRSW